MVSGKRYVVPSSPSVQSEFTKQESVLSFNAGLPETHCGTDLCSLAGEGYGVPVWIFIVSIVAAVLATIIVVAVVMCCMRKKKACCFKM